MILSIPCYTKSARLWEQPLLSRVTAPVSIEKGERALNTQHMQSIQVYKVAEIVIEQQSSDSDRPPKSGRADAVLGRGEIANPSGLSGFDPAFIYNSGFSNFPSIHQNSHNQNHPQIHRPPPQGLSSYQVNRSGGGGWMGNESGFIGAMRLGGVGPAEYGTGMAGGAEGSSMGNWMDLGM